MPKSEIIIRIEGKQDMKISTTPEDIIELLSLLLDRKNKSFETLTLPRKFDETTHEQNIRTGLESLPTTEQIVTFIKKQNNFEFSTDLITKELIGRKISSSVKDKDERRLYDNLLFRINTAKKIIARHENGAWKDKKAYGEPRIYYFTKAVQKSLSQ